MQISPIPSLDDEANQIQIDEQEDKGIAGVGQKGVRVTKPWRIVLPVIGGQREARQEQQQHNPDGTKMQPSPLGFRFILMPSRLQGLTEPCPWRHQRSRRHW